MIHLRGLFLVILVILYSNIVKADYISTKEGGAFNESGTWTGAKPGTDVDDDLFINGIVTATEDIKINGGSGLGAINNGGYLKINNGKKIEFLKNFTIKSGGILEVTGDLLSNVGRLYIEEGGILIVHGKLELKKPGSVINGNILVLGDEVVFKNMQVGEGGNLIITEGKLVKDNGTHQYGLGDIYVLNLDADTPSKVVTKDLSDFLENECCLGDLIDSILKELFEEYMPVCNTNIWQGNDIENPKEWLNDDNWEMNLPSSECKVVLPEGLVNYPEIDPEDGEVELSSLTIKSGASLKINAGSKLTIHDNLVVEPGAEFVINNSAISPSSIIVNGIITGLTDVNWHIDEGKYWYIGHSTENVDIEDYTASLISGGNNYKLYRYSSGWKNLTGSQINQYNPLQGFALKAQNAGSILNYSGELNNEAQYDTTGLIPNWHLIANPYPCYIDILDTGLDIGGALKTIWVRTDVGASQRGYSSFNLESQVGQNGGARYIAPGQSFWVRTYSVNDSIIIKNSTRTHGDGGSLKSVSSSEEDVFRLNLVSDYTIDETVLMFRDYGSFEVTKYDSEKKLSTKKVANLYSIKSGSKVAINAQVPVFESQIVPIGYKVGNEGLSDFTLRVTNIASFMSELDVFLHDKYEDIRINLREEDSYTFSPLVNEANDRFELIFTPALTTSFLDSNIELKKDDKVTVYSVNTKAYVHISNELQLKDPTTVSIFDLGGRLLLKEKFDGYKINFNLPLSNKMLIIEVRVDNMIYRRKIESF